MIDEIIYQDNSINSFLKDYPRESHPDVIKTLITLGINSFKKQLINETEIDKKREIRAQTKQTKNKKNNEEHKIYKKSPSAWRRGDDMKNGFKSIFSNN